MKEIVDIQNVTYGSRVLNPNHTNTLLVCTAVTPHLLPAAPYKRIGPYSRPTWRLMKFSRVIARRPKDDRFHISD